MKKIFLVPLVLLAGFGVLLGIAKQFEGISPAAYDAMDGAEIFGRLCSQCHGPDGRGRQGGATYRGKREYWDEASLLEYIDNPTAYQRRWKTHLRGLYMPPVDSRMPQDARERVVRHVLTLMDGLKNP